MQRQRCPLYNTSHTVSSFLRYFFMLSSREMVWNREGKPLLFKRDLLLNIKMEKIVCKAVILVSQMLHEISLLNL